jgi:hypothetical protein
MANPQSWHYEIAQFGILEQPLELNYEALRRYI